MKKFEKSSMVVTITHGVPGYGFDGEDLIKKLSMICIQLCIDSNGMTYLC